MWPRASCVPNQKNTFKRDWTTSLNFNNYFTPRSKHNQEDLCIRLKTSSTKMLIQWPYQNQKKSSDYHSAPSQIPWCKKIHRSSWWWTLENMKHEPERTTPTHITCCLMESFLCPKMGNNEFGIDQWGLATCWCFEIGMHACNRG